MGCFPHPQNSSYDKSAPMSSEIRNSKVMRDGCIKAQHGAALRAMSKLLHAILDIS